MSTEKDRENRRNYIGGSDMGAILGLSPYKTRLQLYLEKIGEAQDDVLNEGAVFWGNTLEPVIANHFARLNKCSISNSNRVAYHDKFEYMRGELDYHIVEGFGEPGVLEIKTASAWLTSEWSEGDSENVPAHYLAQLQWYMGLFGYSYGVLAVLIGGQDYREYMVEYDVTLFDHMVKAAEEFWRRVEDRDPPLATADDVKLLKDRSINDRTELVVFGGDPMRSNLKRLACAKARATSAKRDAETETAAILEAMDKRNVGLITDGDTGEPLAQLNRTSGDRTDWKKAFEALSQEVTKQKAEAARMPNTKHSTTNRFTIKPQNILDMKE